MRTGINRRCAFLTMSDLGSFVSDDHLAYEPLERLGVTVEAVAWDDPGTRWAEFEHVVIRTPWDYVERPVEFVEAIERIDAATRLHNGLDVVRWNLSKAYLLELRNAGVPVVPTTMLESGATPADALEEFRTNRVVVKPLIGASSSGIRMIDRADQGAVLTQPMSPDRLIAQPYLPSVASEGEISLIYMEGRLSHAIRKVPARGDFRSQEEHGAEIRAEKPAAEMLAVAERALAVVPAGPLLYARVDLVRDPGTDRFLVMELELIEPSLYLRMDHGAPARFAASIARLALS